MSKRVSDAKAAGVLLVVGLVVGGAFWVSFLSGERRPAPAEEAALSSTKDFNAGPAEGFKKQLEKSGFEIVDVKFEASPADAAPAQEVAALDPTKPHGLVAAVEPKHDINADPTPAFDPDKQPRTFWTLDFRDGDIFPAGYKVEGVRKTARGVELAPAADGDTSGYRMGSIESPPVKSEFAYNAIAPLWMQEVPEGTSVLFESCTSPDGQAWTEWESANVSQDEISPTLQDGSPNPNYGFMAGKLQYVSAEDNLFQHIRFRVTLISETEQSPALNAVRFYILDSTLGQGRLADASEVYRNQQQTVTNSTTN